MKDRLENIVTFRDRSHEVLRDLWEREKRLMC